MEQQYNIPDYSPYGATRPDLKLKNDRYLRHKDWIEPTIFTLTRTLNNTAVKVCECGSLLRLTSGIIRRHLASEKHLKFADKWTTKDEEELNEWKNNKKK